MSLFLKSGLGLQDSRSYEQDFLKDTKFQKTTGPDSLWPEAGKRLSKKQKDKWIAEWPEQSVKLQAARRNRGIY